MAALLLLLLLLLGSATANTESEAPSTYVVHVSPSHPRPTRSSFRCALRSLPRHLRRPTPRILYTYARSATGFAARLTPSQASALAENPSILAVHPDRAHILHTTHTPSFLHLSPSSGLWPLSHLAADVTVAVLDTGIFPYRPSFNDSSLDSSPPPSSFKGGCEVPNFCNTKIIGAKSFFKGYESALGHPIDESKESKSPLDTEGHGSHTASTAAGAVVPHAGFYDYAAGDARGMATNARIAAYKVCWAAGCFDSDILAAMDAAIADGVDVISLSVGANGFAPSFFRDSIAIGAFGAVRSGIVVSCSAGNSGPAASSAVNVAPWILTVAASTIDREFPADVILGNGEVLSGVSLYAGEPLKETEMYPLVYAEDCGSRLCIEGHLEEAKVAGKIVVCDRGSNARVEKGSAVKLAGGVGMIMANTAENGEELLADSHLIPATMVGAIVGGKIREYIKSDSSPAANIKFRGTVIGPDPPAPKVASFSSRGPNYRAPEILKPDVTAPGVNILAAWTAAVGPTSLEIDPRRVDFNIISGTSMSCPHVSGLAALLKRAHPDWSPAAIKSALMTTAYSSDNSGETIKDLATGRDSTPFVRGAGHVDPNKALDPGLVYDAGVDDYLAFLCSVGYYPWQIEVFTKGEIAVNCSDAGKKLSNPGGLNYPSFAVVFSSNTDVVTYNRTVRNVGRSDCAVYEAEVSSPAGVEVTVSPNRLEFCEEGQSLSYEIKFASTKDGEANLAPSSHAFGSINWSDGVHNVRSPIAVTWRSSFVASM